MVSLVHSGSSPVWVCGSRFLRRVLISSVPSSANIWNVLFIQMLEVTPTDVAAPPYLMAAPLSRVT